MDEEQLQCRSNSTLPGLEDSPLPDWELLVGRNVTYMLFFNIRCLLCARHRKKCLAWIIQHKIYFRGRYDGFPILPTEKASSWDLNNFLKVTQLVRSRVRIKYPVHPTLHRQSIGPQPPPGHGRPIVKVYRIKCHAQAPWKCHLYSQCKDSLSTKEWS